MKQLFMLVVAMVFCTASFADMQSSELGKNSPQLKALSSAWKTHQSAPRQSKDDLTMVYGGEDVDPSKPTLTEYTTSA